MRSFFAFLTLIALQLIVVPAVLVATEAAVAYADELEDSGLGDTGYLPGEEETVAEGTGCPFLDAHPALACPYLAAVHTGCPYATLDSAHTEGTPAACPWATSDER